MLAPTLEMSKTGFTAGSLGAEEAAQQFGGDPDQRIQDRVRVRRSPWPFWWQIP